MTDDIRSTKIEIVKVPVNRIEDWQLIEKYGRIVAEHGSFVVLARNKTADASKLSIEAQSIPTTINLPGAKFDPVSDPSSSKFVSGAVQWQEGEIVTSFSLEGS